MKNFKKKVKVEQEEQEDLEFNGAIDPLLEALVQEASDRTSKGHDAFELYQNQLHAHLHENLFEFKERFCKGYKILLEAIRQGS